MIWLALLLVLMLFSFVLMSGAPYLPTRRAQGNAALDLLNLPKGSHLLELGCGDGRVLKLAAQRGLKATGYELNPLLAAIAWINTLRYRRLVSIKCQSLWRANLNETDGIYVFLLDRFMARLDAKISAERRRPLPVASYAFKIPGKKPAASKKGIFLYRYK